MTIVGDSFASAMELQLAVFPTPTTTPITKVTDVETAVEHVSANWVQ